MSRLTPDSFGLRGLRYEGDRATSSFTATLMCADQIVAEISGRLGAVAEIDVTPANPFYWEQFVRVARERGTCAPSDVADEPAANWLLEMADDWYHARRLQVTSLKHTTFRLRGDPPGTFRYLRGRPYSLEVEGQLRLTYGRKLEQVFRRGAGSDLDLAA